MKDSRLVGQLVRTKQIVKVSVIHSVEASDVQIIFIQKVWTEALVCVHGLALQSSPMRWSVGNEHISFL